MNPTLGIRNKGGHNLISYRVQGYRYALKRTLVEPCSTLTEAQKAPPCPVPGKGLWVLVLSCHNKETKIFTTFLL